MYNQKRFVGLSSQTRTGCDNQALSTVPVKVKARGKEKIIEAYALIDNRSTETSCSDSLINRLSKEGRKCQFSLATINGVKKIANNQCVI